MSAAASPHDTLARWLAEDESLRARHAGRAPSPVPPEAARGRAGLDVLRDMVEGRLPSPPIAQTLDFVLVHVEPGVAVFQGRPGAAFLNPMGGLHGGWYATLLDSCVGCAVHTTMPPGRGYTTLELKLNIVRAIGPDVALVRAEGRLVGPDGKLYAHASTTCLVFDLPN